MITAIIVLGICIVLSTMLFIGWQIYSHSSRYAYSQEKIAENMQKAQEIENNIQTLSDSVAAKRQEYKTLNDTFDEYQVKVNQLLQDYNDAKRELAITTTKDEMLKQSYQEKKDALESEYASRFSALQESFKNKNAELQQHFDAKNVELQLNLEEKIADFNLRITTLQKQLEEQQTIYSIAVEQNRKDQENEEKHLLSIPVSDQWEIQELNAVCSQIKNPLPLRKAIYDIYYKTPLATLVNDLQVKGITGIYKITDMTNNKIYIGQSVDIAERWKQHLKRGCGAEVGTISGSKLYNAMMVNCLWNFKFEVLQECDKSELNKLEKHWINYFDSVEYGYNMKAGG